MLRINESFPVKGVAAALIGSAALAGCNAPRVSDKPGINPKIHVLSSPAVQLVGLETIDGVDLRAGGGITHKQRRHHEKSSGPHITLNCLAHHGNSVMHVHLRGKNNEQLIYEYFRRARLLSPAADAGVGGNTKAESGDDPTLEGGVFQYGGKRLDQEVALAYQEGKLPSGLCPQLDYSSEELTGGPMAAENDRAVLSQLRQAATPTIAAYVVMQYYERPLTNASEQKRVDFANAIYARYALPHHNHRG